MPALHIRNLLPQKLTTPSAAPGDNILHITPEVFHYLANLQSHVHHVKTIFTQSNLSRLNIVAGLRQACYKGLDVGYIEVAE